MLSDEPTLKDAYDSPIHIPNVVGREIADSLAVSILKDKLSDPKTKEIIEHEIQESIKGVESLVKNGIIDRYEEGMYVRLEQTPIVLEAVQNSFVNQLNEHFPLTSDSHPD